MERGITKASLKTPSSIHTISSEHRRADEIHAVSDIPIPRNQISRYLWNPTANVALYLAASITEQLLFARFIPQPFIRFELRNFRALLLVKGSATSN